MSLIKKKLSVLFSITIFVLPILLLNGCTNELGVIFPEWGENMLIDDTTPLTSEMKARFEGIYNVEQGSDQFGSSVIIQWNGSWVSIYTGKSTGYLLMQGGNLDSVVYLEGYWRYQSSANTGLAQLRDDSRFRLCFWNFN